MCKTRFNTISKHDLSQGTTPDAVGKKRKGHTKSTKHQKVRVKRRDARFYDDPNDYPHMRRGLYETLHSLMHPTYSDHDYDDDDDDYNRGHGPDTTFLPFFRLREMLLQPRPMPRPPLPPPPMPLPSSIQPSLLHLQRRPAAADPPPSRQIAVIDLTDEPSPRLPPALIDLTGDSPVEVLSDDGGVYIEPLPAPRSHVSSRYVPFASSAVSASPLLPRSVQRDPLRCSVSSSSASSYGTL